MAGTKISALPSASSVSANDLLAIVDAVASETRKITAEVLGKQLVKLGVSVGPIAPTSPYNGQPWIDTSTNPPLIKVWNGASWTIASMTGTSILTSPGLAPPADPMLGMLWQDTSQDPDQLKMWDGSNWVRTDPQGITLATADARYTTASAVAAAYLPKSGGTLTGALTLPGVPSSTNQAATKGYVDTAVAGVTVPVGVPSGTVIWVARNTAPTGYLKANGAAVSRTTYADLFSAIGTTFGTGDGSTTFNLPDLRGEFVRGWDNGRGADNGRGFGSAQADAFKSHTHPTTVTNPSGYFLKNEGTGIGLQGSPSGTLVNYQGSVAVGVTVDSTGGVETRPRNIALLACIKF